jgi:assimilatory nitrate reductase catalytic subunit
VGCGVLARRTHDRVEISGDPDHPANFGRLCSKGSALGDTLGLEERLLHPQVDDNRVTWDEALSHVAGQFSRIIEEHGPEAVAFYVSGQLLTEDYYVANKLMKGFIGTANIDTNSRLCMASAVAGHNRAFGEDLVPVCYEDLDHADLIVLVGSNSAWCHPILFQRIERAKQLRPDVRIVVLDPRRTPTCEIADLHLPLRSGTDVWLFNGLLAFLHEGGFADTAFVQNHTADVGAALATAQHTAGDVHAVANVCGIDADRISEFYRLFAQTPRVVTIFSQGVNQSSAGTDKVNSIINCHLLTGRIGRVGAGPFSVTGQPNAMGGREVGGMATTLAAHMNIGDPAHRRIVQDFWSSPRIAARAGLKAVELFDAVHAGRIKALWIMATNPVVSLPDADQVREGLKRCELVVISDCIARTDTTALAHVLLPAAAWGEKDGTVTNSERRISRQRAFLPLPREARPDWWIVCEVAKRMGFARGFEFRSAAAIFDEHARLSGTHNAGSRAFDISGIAGLSLAEYDTLEPVQWPVRAERSATSPSGETKSADAIRLTDSKRLFTDSRFFHGDGRARFVSTPPRAATHATDAGYPFVLNTGRIRDQWHTMTRTGLSPRLVEHLPEPYADLHPQDALLNGLREGELVRVATRWGSLVARVRTSGEIARGTIFVPIHWNACHASDARVGALVNPTTDPLSGEPEFKHTPARVEPFNVAWYGIVLTRTALEKLDAAWWTLVRGNRYMRYELADRQSREWHDWTRELFDVRDPRADYLDCHDTGTGVYRAALVVDDRLAACSFVSPRPELPSRSWLANLFAKERLDDTDRMALLAGRPITTSGDVGPLVCSCFTVGRKTLLDAIAAHCLENAAQVGAHLKAGTNCGSCLPEIRSLLNVARSNRSVGKSPGTCAPT